MYAFLVGDKSLRALPIRFHEKLLPVTPSARRRNISMAYGRLRIVGGQYLMGPSVTVRAGCGGSARSFHFGVITMRVSFLRIRMTLRAGNLLGRRGMRQVLDIRMAIDT